MPFEVRTLPNFESNLKPLIKKYPSLKSELLKLIDVLEKNPMQGIPLGSDFYKIRLAIKSKGKGKSGGARVITAVKVVQQKVYLAAIYDKSEAGNITDGLLKMIAGQVK